jgi:hypothetical protein
MQTPRDFGHEVSEATANLTPLLQNALFQDLTPLLR